MTAQDMYGEAYLKRGGAAGEDLVCLDPDAAAALTGASVRGMKALEIGTGAGAQAVGLARLGLRVTAIDTSEQALNAARQLAFKSGCAVNFVRDDILDSGLNGPYDVVLDLGIFHALTPDQRNIYATTVYRLMTDRGLLLVKAIAGRVPDSGSSSGMRPQDFDEAFGRLFSFEYIKASDFHGITARPPKALFCAMRKM